MTHSSKLTLFLALSVVAASAFTTGCGLAETTAVAAAEAKSAQEQAKQGKEMEEKVKRDLEAANKAAADNRQKAEEATQ